MKMSPIYLLSLLLACVANIAQANNPKEQYATDKREAEMRYAEDRAICNDERNQGQRMKCMRTAKAENTASLSSAKSRMREQSGKSACAGCGKVTAVNVNQRKGESNALGMIAGGAAGALLGNQVGGGSGRKVATVAGAIGGAYAGKKIQESANSSTTWNVDVQYDNGQRGSFSFERDPGVQRGDRVQNAGQSIKRI